MSGLFATALDQLDATRMLRTEAEPHLKSRLVAAGAPPTNQEILDAAKKTYHANQKVVDLKTTTGVEYVKTSDAKPHIAAMNDYDWKSKNTANILPTVKTINSSKILAPAIAAANDDPTVFSQTLGIAASAQLIVGGEGGLGIASGSDGSVKGFGYLAGKIGLDIDVAINLSYGIWASSPAGLAGDFYGIEVNLDLEVGVSAAIFVKRDMSFYGIVVGIGVGVGGGATLVGGYTWVF